MQRLNLAIRRRIGGHRESKSGRHVFQFKSYIIIKKTDNGGIVIWGRAIRLPDSPRRDGQTDRPAREPFRKIKIESWKQESIRSNICSESVNAPLSMFNGRLRSSRSVRPAGVGLFASAYTGR